MFIKEKYKVLHMEGNNPKHQDRLGAHVLGRSFAEKALELLMDIKLTSVPMWQRWPTAFWAVLAKALPAD